MGTLGTLTGGGVGLGEVVLLPVKRPRKAKIVFRKHFQYWEWKAGNINLTAAVTTSPWPVHAGTGALLERRVSREQQRQWMP